MTIKDFSKLCNCTTQTLRYYDHVNLLKPARVDDWTGYRYYSEEQALLYVKIKNFQEADFTIEEIKKLLDKDDDEVYAAFDRKIAEREQQLRTIRQIQQSYRNEMNAMKNTIEQFIEKMNMDAKQYDPAQEFGINEEYHQKLLERFDKMMREASYIKEVSHDKEADGLDNANPVFEYKRVQYEDTDEDLERDTEEEEYLSPLEDPDYTIVAQYHDWNYIKEIKDNFAGLEENTEYNFYLEVTPDKECSVIFCFIIQMLVQDMNAGRNVVMPSCNMTASKDNKNHLYILKMVKK